MQVRSLDECCLQGMDIYAGLLAQDGDKQEVDRYVHMRINNVIQGGETSSAVGVSYDHSKNFTRLNCIP